MSEATKYELTRVIGLAVLVVLIGKITGHHLVSILAGLLIYLSSHLYYLINAILLIKKHERFNPPYPSGLWGEIYQSIDKLQLIARKRKQGLSRFAQRFRDAASAIPDALVILNKEDKVEWANPAAKRLLDVSWPQSFGRSIKEVVHYPFLNEYLEQADYFRPLEYTPATNKAIVLSLRITPFGGKKRQRLLVARDITKISHLNQIRRDFVANVSHELRTPLTVITGFVENLLHSDDRQASQERPLILMQQQASRMQSIINDLLMLSRLEMSNRAIDQEAIDLPHLIEQVVEEASALSAEKEHKFEVRLNHDLWLLANPSEIRSVISNLVFNAVRHTPEHSKISIFWGLDDRDSACFSVSDSGEGIPAIHIPRLTERFYRADKGRSRQSGGTGLGLAIVKHILNRHASELNINSKIGVGSTFSCLFPKDAVLSRQTILADEERAEA